MSLHRRQRETAARWYLFDLEDCGMADMEPRDHRQVEIYLALAGRRLDVRCLTSSALHKITELHQKYCQTTTT